MKTMSLDESGNDNPGRVNREYPVFVVGGVILEDEHIPMASEAISALKWDLFDRDDFVLHTAEFKRSRGAFARMQEEGFRGQFYERLYEMMRTLEFNVVACVFELERYASSPQAVPPSLYPIALQRLTEQFCGMIGDRYHGGCIRIEKGRREQNHAVEGKWKELRESGTPQTSAEVIRNRIEFLVQHTKKEQLEDEQKGRLIGLELADFVVTPIGRHFAGYPDGVEWDLVHEKFYIDMDSAVTIYPEQG